MNKILNEISSRFSPMAFSNVKPTEESMQRMLEAARWAPSSYNEQPWLFVLTLKGSEQYDMIYQSLIEYNQTWAESAPVLGVVFGKTHLQENGKLNSHFMYDAGAAMSNFYTQATFEGYQLHQMGGYDIEKLEKSLQIGEGLKSIVVFALGVPGDVKHLPQDMQARAKAERVRKPLEEISKIYLG
ncbi:MAG: nitroreductase family protein [Bacteroidales bacterium]|nr:nitroreductase family protein [Bacteroidales bacterium]